MSRLRLAPRLTWHARGRAAFAWDPWTGDVSEMSLDLVALCLAFADGAEVERACSARPGGLDPATARRHCETLRRRGLLEERPLAIEDLARRRPWVPRFAVHLTRGEDAVVYGRERTLVVEGGARFLARADGRRSLAELAPRDAWPSLLALCAADLAALKLLPSSGPIPAWAESTMPWPRVDPAALVAGQGAGRPDALADYHQAIGDADAQFDDTETTLSHLLREPHAALGGQTFGARLGAWLLARGVPRGARVVEVGGGLGWLGAALVEALSPRAYLVVDRSPSLARAQRRRGLLSVVGDALRLPVLAGTVDLLVSNEMAGDLGSDEEANHGALALVAECARALAPGGIAWISEFGHPTRPPRRSDHLDHDEFSIRFEDLRRRAVEHGLDAEIVSVPAVVGLDPQPLALSTTRASFAALRRLLSDHGAPLPKRAWLVADLEAHARAHGLDLSRVHGLPAAPIGQRTMGLLPSEFWAVVLRRP